VGSGAMDGNFLELHGDGAMDSKFSYMAVSHLLLFLTTLASEIQKHYK
jgi:hypothetical protein